MSRHIATKALADRLRALDARRYACLASDLHALGGDLVTEAPALSVLDRLVGEIEALTGALTAKGAADLRDEVERLRREMGRR